LDKKVIVFELTLGNQRITAEVFNYDKNTPDEQISKDYEEWAKEKILKIRGSYFEAVTWEN
jgi:hypothetical protein